MRVICGLSGNFKWYSYYCCTAPKHEHLIDVRVPPTIATMTGPVEQWVDNNNNRLTLILVNNLQRYRIFIYMYVACSLDVIVINLNLEHYYIIWA